MQNRKKLIELFIYVVIVVVGIVLLLTAPLKKQEIESHKGGAGVAAVSVK